MCHYDALLPDVALDQDGALDALGFVRSIRLDRDSVPSFDRYPFGIPAVRNLDELELDAGDREVILSILGAGDLLGEMSLIDSVGRSASAVTLGLIVGIPAAFAIFMNLKVSVNVPTWFGFTITAFISL